MTIGQHTPMARDALSRLSSWLRDTGTTQAELGKALRCDRSHVSRILSGKRMPTIKQAVRLQALTRDWAYGPICVWEWDEPDNGEFAA